MLENDILWRQEISKWLALVTLVYASFQYAFMFYRRRGRHANINVHFVFFGSLTLLVLDVFDEHIYNLSGMNNLFWYLGYGLAAITMYLIGVSICRIAFEEKGNTTEQLIHLGFFAVIAILSFLYYSHLQFASNWPKRLPRDWGEFIFSQTLFIYATIIGLISIIGRLRFLKTEQNLVVRARTCASLLAASMAFLCFFAKVCYLGIAFFYMEIVWINKLALFALVALVLFWAIGIMPTAVYVFLLDFNPFRFINRIRQLYTLQQLLIKLNRICPLPQHLPLDTPQAIVRDPNQEIYRTIIAILDRYNLLKGFIEQPESCSPYRPAWTDQELQTARQFCLAFSPVDENRESNYIELTKLLLQIYKEVEMVEVPHRPVRLRFETGAQNISPSHL